MKVSAFRKKKNDKTPKNVLALNVRKLLFQNSLRRSTCSRVSNTAEICTPNFPLLLDNLSWKISLLIISEILGLFLNTLTADRMYSYDN